MPTPPASRNSGYTFKSHEISDAERLWLKEAIRTTPVDPRIIKVRLLGKLSVDFDPESIDFRIWHDDALTLVGRWIFDAEDPIFAELDRAVRAIRERIMTKGKVDVVTAKEIAADIGLDETRVEELFYNLAKLFSSGGAGRGDGSRAYLSLSLTGKNGYDRFLGYTGIWDDIERFYVTHAARPGTRPVMLTTFPVGDAYDVFGQQVVAQKATKPDTAFVLMAMDPAKPEIEDVYMAIKEVCHDFGIRAYRADEIEHQDRITDVVLNEIETCEFLIADLTYERPNVYYEIGYAHALNKKPILYRHVETRVHFDLSVHNVPPYKNVTELRKLLRDRLKAVLGRDPKINQSDPSTVNQRAPIDH